MCASKKFSILFFLFFSQNANAVIYKAKPLEFLPISSENAKTVSFNYNVYNKANCRKYLGRDKVISRGFQPVQISLTNNTDRFFILSLDNCIAPETVAEALHFNTAARVVGWTIGGLFLWPFFIPAIVEAMESPIANDHLDDDYSRKSLVNNQIVKPFSNINGLIFLPKESFKNEFSFELVDSENNERLSFSSYNKINSLNNTVYTDKKIAKHAKLITKG